MDTENHENTTIENVNDALELAEHIEDKIEETAEEIKQEITQENAPQWIMTQDQLRTLETRILTLEQQLQKQAETITETPTEQEQNADQVDHEPGYSETETLNVQEQAPVQHKKDKRKPAKRTLFKRK